MNLKNYTSNVPVINSISKIEKRLVDAGATHISKSYKEGKPDGMIFQIPANGIPITFQLPAKIDKIFDYMIKHKKMGYKRSVQENTSRQAEMTGWKLLSDWIDAQVSFILIEQVDAIELFLPYAYDIKSSKTIYEIMKESNFKLLESHQ